MIRRLQQLSRVVRHVIDARFRGLLPCAFVLASAGSVHAIAPAPVLSWLEGETGACCIEDQSVCYENLTAVYCQILDGEWLGPGSTCDECDVGAIGACCFNGDDCIDSTASFCESADGVWLGPDTTCNQDGDDCGREDPLGACCIFTSCLEYTESTCIAVGGFWLGGGTTCAAQGEECTEAPIFVPEDFDTIQEAIDAAVDGAQISVAPGVHGGSGLAAVDLKGKQIRLFSREGAFVTYITGGDLRRVIECSSGESESSSIEGFTIFGGLSNGSGGGIYCIGGSSPVFQNCVIRANTAANGGGCAINGGNSRFIDCEFLENVATDHGAALEIRGDGYPQVVRCQFVGNVAALQAGRAAINVRPGGNLFIEDSVVCGNLPEQVIGDWVDGGGNLICQCPVDVTGDGVVDGFDLTDLLASWGACGPACPHDFDGNGLVDGGDLLVLLSAWGPCA